MLGHTLKLVRLYNKIEENTAADYLHMWNRKFQKIESCKIMVSLTVLKKLSEFYQMPISQILVLNDKKEHFQFSDSEILKDIERYYVTKQDETEELVKRKNLRCKDVRK